MSRFLVFSDLHLNLWKYGAYAQTDWTNSRFGNQLRFLDQMAIYAHTSEIKNILFCGDFFHTPGHVKTEVLQGACRTLRTMTELHRLNFVWLVGNHDQADRKGQIHSLDFLEEFGQFANPYTPIELDDMPPIWGLDYTEDQDSLLYFFDQMVDNHPRYPDPPIVLLHQGVSGVELNSKGFSLNEILTPEMIPPYILHAYAGHYHSYKRVNDRLTIPGSCMQLNWGDAGEPRGFLDVMTDGPQIHTKHIESRCNRFVKIKYDPDLLYKDYPKEAFLRIAGVPKGADMEGIKSALYGSGTQAVEVEYIEENEEALSAEQFDTFDNLFETYVDTNKIDGRQLDIGKAIINQSYEHGIELDEDNLTDGP